jgi:hypothetical protein
MTREAIDAGYPGLIEALTRHPGIGTLVVRSAAGHVLAMGSRGTDDLTGGQHDGDDFLIEYGPRAVENLLHLESFENAGDLVLLGAVDRLTGEVTGFEELVGSHGGLGGWQDEPFILCPATLTMGDEPLVGAPAIYRQLTAWQAQLRAERGA